MVVEEELEQIYDVIIIIPTLNEESGISVTLDSIRKELGAKFRFKIVVVDGLSTDRTVEIAKSMGAKVIKQRRKGYGDALQAGFYYADTRLKSNIMVMMDADGTYDPKDILKMIEIIDNGQADFVIGNRFSMMDKESMSRTNRIGNKILSAVARRLLNIKMYDTQCGIRAFKSDLAKIFYNAALGMPFAMEMLAMSNQYQIKMEQIPVSYHKRLGIPKLNPMQDGTRILVAIIRLMRDTRPLAFFCSIGLAMILLGVFFGTTVLWEYLRTGVVSRIPTTILSVLLIVVGVQTISLGLISDMVKNKNQDRHVFFSD